MANSLAYLATNSRFALLEISDDDEDEGERNLSNTGSKNTKSGNKTGQNSTDRDAGTAKSTKKSKRKKHKSKGGNTDTAVERTITTIKKPEEWSGWMARDEQYVLSQFQRDMQAALEESKQEAVSVTNKNTKAQAELSAEVNSMTGGKEQKKKKEKAVAMSLDEFVSGLGAGKMEHTNQKTLQSSEQEGTAHMMSLDSFAVMETTTPAADTESTMWHQVNAAGSSHIHPGITTPSQETFLDEKPPQSTKTKKSSRKRDTNKSEEDSCSKENTGTQSSSEKKILTASKEDEVKREEMQAQSEIVLVQEELDKKNALFEKLKKAFKKQNVTIEELKKELSQVKKRNKQLYFILSQGEMKEKSDLVMQIEELNDVKEQVVQLHAELEQERSRSSVFKSELAKLQGKTWQGSSS